MSRVAGQVDDLPRVAVLDPVLVELVLVVDVHLPVQSLDDVEVQVDRADRATCPLRDGRHVDVGPDVPARGVEGRKPGLADGRPGGRHQAHLLVGGRDRHPWPRHDGADREADPGSPPSAAEVERVHLPVRPVAPLRHHQADPVTLRRAGAHAGTSSSPGDRVTPRFYRTGLDQTTVDLSGSTRFDVLATTSW